MLYEVLQGVDAGGWTGDIPDFPQVFEEIGAGLSVCSAKSGRAYGSYGQKPKRGFAFQRGVASGKPAVVHYKNFYGDFSFRVIPSDFPLSSLRLTESDFDRKGFEADPASLFPLPELKTVLAEFGGTVATHHFSLLGFNLKRKEFLEETVPAILKILREDKTDLVLLIPACVVCHEILPQMAAVLEEADRKSVV